MFCPFDITQVHTNGTVTIALNDHVSERINIRRIRPKFPLQPVQPEAAFMERESDVTT